jgi:hypothetical protein
MSILVILSGFGWRKNKANLFRSEFCVMRIAKRDLKKQSQFAGGQNDVKLVIVETYGDLCDWKLQKNKAKQSQTKPIQSQTKPKNWIPACAGMTVSEPRRRDAGQMKGWLSRESGALTGRTVSSIVRAGSKSGQNRTY